MLPSLNNPFLAPFGPSVEETGIRPEGPDPAALDFALSARDRHEAMRALLDQQYANLRQETTFSAIPMAGKALGYAARPVLRPLAEQARTGLANLLYAKSGPVTRGAAAVSGTNPLLAAATPTAGATDLAATISEAPETFSAGASPAGEGASVLGSLGAILGAAGAGYGAYQGLEKGKDTLANLHGMERSGELDEGELDANREAAFRSGMVEMGKGGATGALGGLALGPIGAVIGGLAGGAGGALTATRAYKDSDNPALDTFKASLKFFKNPFKKVKLKD